jgi:hypothetical protein
LGGGSTIQNLSLDSFSTLSISGGGFLAVAGSTITNAGQINVGNSSTVYIESSTCTFSGGGTVNLGINSNIQGLYEYSSTQSLVNQDNMIQGQGTISYLSSFINGGTVNANVSGGQLSVALATNFNGYLVTNNGTLEATGGGELVLGNVTNTNGTIFAGSSSSVYIVPYATIIGGNLTSASGGEIQGAVGATLQGVTITQGSTYSVYSGAWNALSGNLVNQGTVLMGGNGIGSTLYIESSTSTFSGGGTVNLNNSSIQGVSSTQSLVNQDNTIQGQGVIGYLSSFINGGTVNASGGTLSIESVPTTNNGTFQVTEGSTLQVNTSFTTTGTVNIGALTDTSASLFQMAGGNDYVQTSGTTSLWSAHSTLSAPTVNIEGGLLQGFGTIQGNLINSGTVHPGDGPGILTVMGNYTQNSGGILDIAIGGLTSGSQYSVLSVSGRASLSGMLEVDLMNGFSPTIDDKFVILTSSGLSGTFADNTIQVGNVTFDIEYSPAGYKNDVVLLVAQVSSVPEPASLVMLTIGIAGVGVYVARRRGKTARACGGNRDAGSIGA